ncbi:MAG: exonuclease domain-containing protein [Desulfuromonadales bacterium]
MSKSLGDKLSPAIKYWAFLIGIITVIFAVIFGSFTASYLNLDPAEQVLVEDLFDKLVPFPFIGAIILVAFVCTMVSLLFRYYIIPVLRMAEQTRLITAANPDYRITPEGARELTTLARIINESAEAFQKLQNEVKDKIRESNQALKIERNRLAALMAELPYGVVVCNLDGRIMLYNRLASEMLGGGADRERTIGLGRSIFGILDRAPLVHALEVINHGCAQEQSRPALGVMTQMCGSRFIRVNMTPVSASSTDAKTPSLSGFVLSLEDITGEIDAVNERDKLLQRMIDDVQESLGRLHQGIEKICAMPGTESDACERHRQAIASVSRDLEAHLARARQLYSEHHHAYGNRENVDADTLISLIAKNIDERFSLQVKSEAAPSLWLKIDSYALVQAFATLAGALKAEYGLDRVHLSVTAQGTVTAILQIAWPDRTLPAQAIQEWLALPLFMDSAGTTDSPQAIIEKHAGQVTIDRSEDQTCSGIRIALPTVHEEDVPSLHSAIAPRPVFYEFDLFHQPGQAAMGKRSLRQLTFVAFDTETTGLNPAEGDEIIQLGAVRIVNGRVLAHECIDQLVNPQRPVPKASVKIHGIDPELLSSQPLIGDVLRKFHAFTEDAVLVAHNAAFDMRFLQIKQEALDLSFDNPVLDTLLLSSIVHPNQDGHSLDAIAERFNLTIVGRHTALGDALVTAEVLLKLIPLLEAQGITTLDEALEASRTSPFAKINY